MANTYTNATESNAELVIDTGSTGFTSITLSVMDLEYNGLDSQVIPIVGNDYKRYSTSLLAPDTAAIGAITF